MVCPVATPYLPEPQAVQDVSEDPPFSTRYLPASHAVHGPPFAPEYPSLQVQLDKPELRGVELVFAGQVKQVDEPTANEYVPRSQSIQVVSPLTFLYLPVTHVVQALPLFPQYPTWQEQLVTDSLPGGAFEFSGQVEHKRCDVLVHAAV